MQFSYIGKRHALRYVVYGTNVLVQLRQPYPCVKWLALTNLRAKNAII